MLVTRCVPRESVRIIAMPSTRRKEGTDVRIHMVPQTGGSTRVFIEGGFMADECVWSPTADLVRGTEDNLFLKVRAGSKKVQELCGKSLGFSRWLHDLTMQRNEACNAKLDQAIGELDASQRANSPGMSRRSQHALVRLPEDVELQVDGEPLRVLCTLDHRNVVAVKLDEESINKLVKCIRSSESKGARWAKRPRDEWITFKYPQVKWNYERESMYVIYSDDDGVVHRKFKKPFSIRPESDELADAKIEETAEWLHSFYTDNHKGPIGIEFPDALFEGETDDCGTTHGGDGNAVVVPDSVGETHAHGVDIGGEAAVETEEGGADGGPVLLPEASEFADTLPDSALNVSGFTPEPEENPEE